MRCLLFTKLLSLCTKSTEQVKEGDITMPSFSGKSKAQLATCDKRLQKVFNEVVKHVDCTVLEGVRSLDRQKELVRTGKSKTLKSRHLPNSKGESEAADVVPYPIDWNNKERFYLFAGFVKGIAAGMGIKLRMGADWDGDFTTRDQTFHDLPHFEIDE